MTIDPVCTMEVDEKTAQFVMEYRGNKYYFCAPGCKKAFEENSEKYMGSDTDTSITAVAGTECV